MLLICKRCGVKAHREREKRVRSQRGINYLVRKRAGEINSELFVNVVV